MQEVHRVDTLFQARAVSTDDDTRALAPVAPGDHTFAILGTRGVVDGIEEKSAVLRPDPESVLDDLCVHDEVRDDA